MSSESRFKPSRRAVVWFHRSRAIVWAIVGAVSFPLGWANSVVLVWVASLYANVATDWGNGEAADNRELLDRLDRQDETLREILARLPAGPATPRQGRRRKRRRPRRR